MFKSLRPVGSFVKYKPTLFNETQLLPYRFIGLQSGTAALAAAINIAKQKRPEVSTPEIIVAGYTCPDILSACQFSGVKVRLVDFEASTPWMDIAQIKENMNHSTVAIIAINFLGIPERIQKIRKEIDLTKTTLIEDCAQGFTSDFSSNYWQGDLITLSFGRGKPISLFGGGAVLSTQEIENKNRPELILSGTAKSEDFVYRIKSTLFKLLGKPACYYWLVRMPFLGLGKTEFKELTSISPISNSIKKQLNIGIQEYQENMKKTKEILDCFRTISAPNIINLPNNVNLDASFSLLRYPLLIKSEKKKEFIFKELTKNGLGVSSLYEKPLYRISNIPNNIIINQISLKHAEQFSKELITIPCHTGVQLSQAEKIKRILMKKTQLNTLSRLDK